MISTPVGNRPRATQILRGYAESNSAKRNRPLGSLSLHPSHKRRKGYWLGVDGSALYVLLRRRHPAKRGHRVKGSSRFCRRSKKEHPSWLERRRRYSVSTKAPRRRR